MPHHTGGSWQDLRSKWRRIPLARLDVVVRPDGFSAVVRPSRESRFAEAWTTWPALLFFVVTFTVVLYGTVSSLNPAGLCMGPVILGFVAVAVYNLNDSYGHDEVAVEGGSLVVRSVGPLGTRTRLQTAPDEGYAWAVESLFGDEPYTVLISEGAGGRTVRVRYPLTSEDSASLVTLIGPGGPACSGRLDG
jgi:hypothetical protein